MLNKPTIPDYSFEPPTALISMRFFVWGIWIVMKKILCIILVACMFVMRAAWGLDEPNGGPCTAAGLYCDGALSFCCSSGYYCPQGQTEKLPCPAGYYCPFASDIDETYCSFVYYTVLPCPDGTYSTGMATQCTACSQTPCDPTTGELVSKMPCALGISELKLSAGVSIPLWAERYTIPALCVGYNGGVCYADALVGQEINTLNIAYNDMVYHLVAQVSSGGDTGGGDTGGDDVAEKYVFEFNVDTEYGDSSFRISAAGTFYVDWGGVEQVIEKNNTDRIKYSCPKSSGASCDVVRLGGRATAYSATEAAIWFDDCYDHDMQMTHIDGCLGCIFPTLADGSQPRFISTFSRCQIETIPENLFDGISGAPVSDMFNNTFYDCSGLTAVPAGLFAGISGAPASGMFKGTFFGCRGLTGTIPENLFAGLDVNAPLQDGTFEGTFSSCTGLTGPSARIGGQYLYEIWPDATWSQVGGMYGGSYNLDDFVTMPGAWRGY